MDKIQHFGCIVPGPVTGHLCIFTSLRTAE